MLKVMPQDKADFIACLILERLQVKYSSQALSPFFGADLPMICELIAYVEDKDALRKRIVRIVNESPRYGRVPGIVTTALALGEKFEGNKGDLA